MRFICCSLCLAGCLAESSMFAWMPRRVSRTSPVTLLLLVSISCAIWGMMKSASCTKKCEGSCAWGSTDGCEGGGVWGRWLLLLMLMLEVGRKD